MPPRKNELVRAFVLLYGGKTVESIWVRKIRGNEYKVCSIPFYAYNLSLCDIVLCRPDEDGEGLFVERVLRKSGNRTVRVAFDAPDGGRHPEAIKLKRFLQRNHIKYDFNGIRVFSINVPSEEIYQKLLARLEKIPASAQMVWEDGDPQPGVNLDGTDQVPAQSEEKPSG